MDPEQIPLSTEAPAVPVPPFALVYQFRWMAEGSERVVYGFGTVADALENQPLIQPDDPGKRITIEAEPTIVRFEDLHARDREEYFRARTDGDDHAIYFLIDGETIPTPPPVEITSEAREEVRNRLIARYPGLAAAQTAHQPGSYAAYVAGREARLARKAEKRAEWAESRQKKAEAAFKREHAILSVIPPGQPILVGHHSEKRHRRDLSRAESACQQGIEHSKMAKTHAYKSEACAAALEMQTDPGFCQRRIDEAEAGIRKCEKELLWCRVRQSAQASIDHWNLWLGRYREQQAFWSARLESVGGPRVTAQDIKKGDSIRYRGEEFCEVIRVNKKTVTAKVPAGRQIWEMKIPISDILEVKRAEA